MPQGAPESIFSWPSTRNSGTRGTFKCDRQSIPHSPTQTPPRQAPGCGIGALFETLPSHAGARRCDPNTTGSAPRFALAAHRIPCQIGADIDSDRISSQFPGIPSARVFRWSFPTIMTVFLPVPERSSTEPGFAVSNCCSLLKNPLRSALNCSTCSLSMYSR